MERIREYFDRIAADEELKEKTKNFIREKISLEGGKSRKTSWKRLSLAAFPIAACLVILIGGYTYYKTPVNYVSMDINPSVELGLNRFDRVVETEGINADGNKLLNMVRIVNLSVDDAIEKLALAAEENGYIKENGSSVIAVTALSEQNEEAKKLIDQMDESLRALIAKGSLRAVIYTDTADLQLRTQAREFGLSAGKYKMILLLQSLDPDIGIEQYRNAKITDILVKANELSQPKGSAGAEANPVTEQNEKQSPSDPAPEQEQTRKSSDSQIQVILPKDGSTGQEQPTAPYQDQNQDQGQSQSGETSPSSVEAEQGQTENQTQNDMTDQPAEGQEQSNQSQSSGGQGGNQNNKQGPN